MLIASLNFKASKVSRTWPYHLLDTYLARNNTEWACCYPVILFLLGWPVSLLGSNVLEIEFYC